LSAKTKGSRPEVPWARPIALRNRIVHGNWSIDFEILCDTARADVPGLLNQMLEIRAALAEE